MGPILRSAQRSAGGDATAGREPLWGARAKQSKEEEGEAAILAVSPPMTQECAGYRASEQDRAARL